MSKELQFPPTQVPAVMNGMFSRAWMILFRGLYGKVGGAPGLAPISISVGSSPFDYVATENGMIAIEGGSVSKIEYKRGTTTVDTGITSGLVKVRTDDTVIVTYSSAPAMTSFPD